MTSTLRTLLDRVCLTCGETIAKDPRHSKNQHAARKFCSQRCNSSFTNSKRVLPDDQIGGEIKRRCVVDEKSGCWDYQMGLDSSGYASFTHQGNTMKGHRLSYTVFVGPIPDGMHILHRCDNRRCLNPSHLSVGSNAENTKDRNDKNRQAKGEANGRARLTVSDAVEILQSGDSISIAARRYDISCSAVQALRSGRTWQQAHALLRAKIAQEEGA